MKQILFAAAMFVAAANAVTVPEIDSSVMLAQTESEQFAQLGLGQASNPIAQAKEAMKELKSGVEQEDAKKMGYAEYNVFKKLRDLLRKKNKKSEEAIKKLKIIMKNGWDGKKTMEKLASDNKGSVDSSESKGDDDKKEDEKKKETDSSDKKSSGKKDRKKEKKDKKDKKKKK